MGARLTCATPLQNPGGSPERYKGQTKHELMEILVSNIGFSLPLFPADISQGSSHYSVLSGTSHTDTTIQATNIITDIDNCFSQDVLLTNKLSIVFNWKRKKIFLLQSAQIRGSIVALEAQKAFTLPLICSYNGTSKMTRAPPRKCFMSLSWRAAPKTFRPIQGFLKGDGHQGFG